MIINIPVWNGIPRQVVEVWTLRKGDRVVSCQLWTASEARRNQANG